MIQPNFFIVGAPKCGTTALYTYLSGHPQVFLPDFKEPHFFGSDLDKRADTFVLDRDDYLGLFAAAGGKLAVGEASSNYVYSKQAAEEIKAFNPQARIIVMLRDPVDLLYSTHSQYLFSGNEDISDFWQALDVERERLWGDRLPAGIDVVQKVHYRTNLAMLPAQIRHFRALFGEDRVLVLLLEEMRDNPSEVYLRAIRFLGLAEGDMPSLEPVNRNKEVTHRGALEIVRKAGKPLGKLRRLISKRPLGIVQWVSDRFMVEKPRTPLDPERVATLTEDLAPWIAEMEAVIGPTLVGMWPTARRLAHRACKYR